MRVARLFHPTQWVCLVALSVCACGGSEGKGDGGKDGGVDAGNDTDAGSERDASANGPAPVPLSTYCEQSSQGYFDWLQRCYGSEPYPESYRDEFVGRIEKRCNHSQTAVDEGRLSYDGVQATRCLEALNPEDCAAEYLPAECEGTFAGLVQEGGTCYQEESLVFIVGVEACADGYCVEDDMCPGTCQPYAQPGADCTIDRCDPAHYCEAGVCRARNPAGMPCARREQCEQDLYCGDGTCVAAVESSADTCDDALICAGTTTCVDGSCELQPATGEPCKLRCAGDAVCFRPNAPEEGECITPREPGGTCFQDEHCASGYCDQQFPGASEGECAALPTAGNACLNGRCAAGASCRYADAEDGPEGTCRMLVAQGGNCLVNEQSDPRRCEEGLFCTQQGTCEPPGNEGEPCDVVREDSCTEGLWCSRQTGLCTRPAAADAACNPLWSASCQSGLGCHCTANDWNMCVGVSSEPDEFHLCRPLRDLGDDCYRDAECTSARCEHDEAANAGTCIEITVEQCLPQAG